MSRRVRTAASTAARALGLSAPKPAAKPAAAAPPAAPAAPAATFTPPAPAAPAPVSGVATPVPAAAPAPLVGTQWKNGTIYDAQAFLTEKLKISGDGSLRVFHHTATEWGIPGVKTKITMRKNAGGAHGQVYGDGFYTSTKPETWYGKYEFQLEIPFAAFAGKKVLQSYSGNEMPPGIDILMVPMGGSYYVIFKPESEYWLNRSAIQADFDRDNDPVGWN
ncbi:MAG: hypothetical protein IPJ65_36925 [Archangiaceae bacterium]|nr:hypothetical protein [Archangiaceae bacterium]